MKKAEPTEVQPKGSKKRQEKGKGGPSQREGIHLAERNAIDSSAQELQGQGFQGWQERQQERSVAP
jgi:hypothetical protein